MMQTKKRNNPWPKVFRELLARFFNAFKSTRFLLSFGCGVLLIGGMGIWLPYNVAPNTLIIFESQNVYTFSMALIGTMFVDFSLNDEKSTDLSSVGCIIGICALVICCYG